MAGYKKYGLATSHCLTCIKVTMEDIAIFGKVYNCMQSEKSFYSSDIQVYISGHSVL